MEALVGARARREKCPELKAAIRAVLIGRRGADSASFVAAMQHKITGVPGVGLTITI
jgi:hypothetical protein